MSLTLTDYWERVEDALPDAHLIAWDECHKIYVALDEAEAEWFRTSDYTLVEGDPDVLLATLHKWYDESCWLRFINGVRHDGVNPNAGFVDLIPQGAEEEHDELCDCFECKWERGEDDDEEDDE